MSNHERDTKGEGDFDRMLESSVSEFPPEDIVAEVTPWKKATNRVLVGMAFRTITLNFWCLNYILPAIGMVLMLLGFRTLRHENKWFRTCFFITVFCAACFFPMLILNTTILQSTVSASSISSIWTLVTLILLFAELICLWSGFRAVQRKVSLPTRTGGAVALIVWYALVCLLAFIRYNGWIILSAMIVGYVFIIRSLYRLSKELNESGYSIRTAPVKVPDRAIVFSIVAFLSLGIVFGYLFGGSYPMEWYAVDSEEHRNVDPIKTHLMELGFPEYVLDDLSAEDLAACDGALQVVVDVTDEAMNDGRTVTAYSGEENRHITQTTVYDVKELRITGIGVQISGERERWIIFHHFLWTVDPGFYGTESIQLWPTYQGISEGWCSGGEVTGRVLYDKNEETFSAAYYSLGNQTFTSNSIFWGNQTSTDVFAAFSMPKNGENYRGYVSYPVDELQDGYIISSWFNYTHQQSWLQYPSMTAMEKRMTNSWNDAGAFRTIQNALQFYPTDEGIEIIN